MKLLSCITICICLGVALGGIIPTSATVESILGRTPNPNDVLAKVKFSPLNYAGTSQNTQKNLWKSI